MRNVKKLLPGTEPFVVLSSQRIYTNKGHHINVVIKKHDVSNVQVWSKSPRSIGYNQSLDTQKV